MLLYIEIPERSHTCTNGKENEQQQTNKITLKKSCIILHKTLTNKLTKRKKANEKKKKKKQLKELTTMIQNTIRGIWQEKENKRKGSIIFPSSIIEEYTKKKNTMTTCQH